MDAPSATQFTMEGSCSMEDALVGISPACIVYWAAYPSSNPSPGKLVATIPVVSKRQMDFRVNVLIPNFRSSPMLI